MLTRDYQKPSSARGEALVKVIMADIYNTDLKIVRGYFGFREIPAMSLSA